MIRYLQMACHLTSRRRAHCIEALMAEQVLKCPWKVCVASAAMQDASCS